MSTPVLGPLPVSPNQLSHFDKLLDSYDRETKDSQAVIWGHKKLKILKYIFQKV